MTAADVLVIDDLRTFAFPAVYARSATDGLARLAERAWREVWLDYSLGDGETTEPIIELSRVLIGSKFDDRAPELKATWGRSNGPMCWG